MSQNIDEKITSSDVALNSQENLGFDIQNQDLPSSREEGPKKENNYKGCCICFINIHGNLVNFPILLDDNYIFKNNSRV